MTKSDSFLPLCHVNQSPEERLRCALRNGTIGLGNRTSDLETEHLDLVQPVRPLLIISSYILCGVLLRGSDSFTVLVALRNSIIFPCGRTELAVPRTWACRWACRCHCTRHAPSWEPIRFSSL
ncbi:hypothetical protein MPTK1_2g16660 [Marchantia polymorpha subsp. ruderalis]|uniref:Uncharacterized protein n=1 Tax=Marchantia polymorpha TaxID=3197 RepID=A0A2R6WCJ3_MARPO|nr:hypothetical protein MARPO_0109s0007 [Marchantia polymorpha]BBN02614.1 hypothetical protein Mp_2g16660 [Marchantia polymorpha subsp. ruderalis]|eukprot:PTQ31572.1 hypothetical protein MARPO_0109s0007 [Marchantia polymorpha]